MKTILFAAAATIAAVPAVAEPARSPSPQRDYRASYDAARGVYCLRVFGAAVADPRPSTPGLECRAPDSWAKRGIAFHRAAPIGDRLARND